jgi:hypothetical protein
MRTDELRTLLHERGEEVVDLGAHERVGAVHERVRGVRRRRAAAAGGGLVAAVAAVALAVVPGTILPDQPAPAGSVEGVLTEDGYTQNGITYRPEVLGERLVGAAIGDPGERKVSFEMTVPRTGIRVSPVCHGVSPDHVVEVSVDGHALTGSGCQQDPDPDPGKDGNTWQHGDPLDRWGIRPGDTVTVTAALTAERKGGRVDGEGAVVGVGIYEDTRPRTELAGVEVPELIEWEGQVWELAWKYESDPGGPTMWIGRDPGDSNGPALTIAAVSGLRGPAKYTVLLDGEPESGGEVLGDGAAGPFWETIGVLDSDDEGFDLRLRVDKGLTDKTRLGFASYDPVD